MLIYKIFQSFSLTLRHLRNECDSNIVPYTYCVIGYFGNKTMFLRNEISFQGNLVYCLDFLFSWVTYTF